MLYNFWKQSSNVLQLSIDNVNIFSDILTIDELLHSSQLTFEIKEIWNKFLISISLANSSISSIINVKYSCASSWLIPK